jgi:outer membrane protein TolC
MAIGALGIAGPTAAQQVAQGGQTIELTLERMIGLTMESSYQVRFLDMGIQQRNLGLQAERANLRSSVSMDLTIPTFQSVSNEEYDSGLGRNVIVRENSRRWEAQLSIQQPVIIPGLGYPTNGYLSLNNRVYRDTEIDEDGDHFLEYYNRYFIRYTQPLFQPNELKNNLEQAELDLEDAEIDYYNDMINIVDDVSDDYFELFETAYDRVIGANYVVNLERAAAAAQSLVASDPNRSIELNQINVELANAREEVQSAATDFRLETAELRTRLNLPEGTQFTLNPVIDLQPVNVDIARATEFAMELTPRLRQLDIQQRQNEMRLEEQQGRGGFSMDLEFTYGREMRDELFGQLWDEPRNTYTVDVNAFVPIWDWGERDARIESQRITLRRTELQMEQTRLQIVSDVENEVRSLEELQARTLTMQENLGLAAEISQESLDLYAAGTITALDLMQSLRREQDTAENFLEAYMGWRRSLQRLQQLTYWDFEEDVPVTDRYGITITSLQQ